MSKLVRSILAAGAVCLPFFVQAVPVSASRGGSSSTAADTSPAVAGRYTFVADPINHVVRLVIGQSEVTFAGNGGMSVEQDNDPLKTQLVGPYAVAVGKVTESASQITHLEVYIADTFANQVRQVILDIP